MNKVIHLGLLLLCTVLVVYSFPHHDSDDNSSSSSSSEESAEILEKSEDPKSKEPKEKVQNSQDLLNSQNAGKLYTRTNGHQGGPPDHYNSTTASSSVPDSPQVPNVHNGNAQLSSTDIYSSKQKRSTENQQIPRGVLNSPIGASPTPLLSSAPSESNPGLKFTNKNQNSNDDQQRPPVLLTSYPRKSDSTIKTENNQNRQARDVNAPGSFSSSTSTESILTPQKAVPYQKLNAENNYNPYTHTDNGTPDRKVRDTDNSQSNKKEITTQDSKIKSTSEPDNVGIIKLSDSPSYPQE